MIDKTHICIAEKSVVASMDAKACQMRFSQNYHLAAVINPSTDTGPQPIHVPMTGYNVFFELVTGKRATAFIQKISASVISVVELNRDSTSISTQPRPSLYLAEDLKVAAERSLENYIPMEIPHFEIFLDATPCIVRPAEDENFGHIRPIPSLPLVVAPSSHLKLVFSPITNNLKLVNWRLDIDFKSGNFEKLYSHDFKISAESGWKSFLPNGEVKHTEVHEIVPHWRCRQYPFP